jgi:hypothetical protein
MPNFKWIVFFVIAGFLSGCLSVNGSSSSGKEYADEPDWGHDPDDDDADGTGGNTSDLVLPFSVGQLWQLTRGYNEGSHQDYGYDWIDDRYALDFALAGCDSWRQPIYPVRGGVVEVAAYDHDGYGHYVLIDHGQGYKSRYAHFDETQISAGQEVTTDTVIGLCGNSGYVLGSACPEHPGTHLHFAFYQDGAAALPEPMSGHENFQTGCWYGHNSETDCTEPDPGDDDDLTDDDDAIGDDDTDECLDADADGYCEDEDCNDHHSQIYPGAPEIEDAWDNDCDSLIDEGTNSYDDDSDGYSENAGDCDDADPSVYPAAIDIECDGVDQDCTNGDNCPPDPDPDPCDYTVPLDVPTIQDAIDLAITGDIVCVEAGDYHEDLVFMGEDITVQSLDSPDSTHLYGVETGTYDALILASAGESASLVGFTLHGAGGRVIEITDSTLHLQQLTIDASVSSIGIKIYGGSGSQIQNVRIDNPSQYGVSIYGGAAGIDIWNLIVTAAGSAGLRASESSEFAAYNSVFYGSGYGGVWVNEGSAHVENSIFVNHTYYGIHLDDSSYTLTADYNTGHDNDLDLASAHVTLGAGNATQDPQFTNPTADFTLSPGSPCENAGNPDSSLNNPDGTRNDQGAYGGPYAPP